MINIKKISDKNDLYGVCPYVTSQKLLQGKWALLILHYLDEQTLRFKELERKLSPITQATLTKQLRTLEHNGLIIRTVYNEIPPKVEYSLSELGYKFKPVLNSLSIWCEEYITHMKSNKN